MNPMLFQNTGFKQSRDTFDISKIRSACGQSSDSNTRPLWVSEWTLFLLVRTGVSWFLEQGQLLYSDRLSLGSDPVVFQWLAN